jgi:hypothetical protein
MMGNEPPAIKYPRNTHPAHKGTALSRVVELIYHGVAHKKYPTVNKCGEPLGEPVRPFQEGGQSSEKHYPQDPGARPKVYKYTSVQVRHGTCAGQGRRNRRAAPGGLMGRH